MIVNKIYRTDYPSILTKEQYDDLYQELVNFAGSKQFGFENYFIDSIRNDFHEQGAMLLLKECEHSSPKIIFTEPKSHEQVFYRSLNPVPFNLKNLLFKEFHQTVFDEGLYLSFDRKIKSRDFTMIGRMRINRVLIDTPEVIIRLDENEYLNGVRDYEISIGVRKGNYTQMKEYFNSLLENFMISPINPGNKYERYLLNNHII